MKIWGQVKTVLWSFIGIGGRDRGEDDKVNLLVVIAVAFVLVALLLGALAFMARHAVAAPAISPLAALPSTHDIR